VVDVRQKWFRVVGIGLVFCSADELRAALPGGWHIEETAQSGVAYR
jgi:hypothetical protein